ncbi:MAG: radical SAM protein [Candidatus Aenigmarchaeota archaeon]|nr:radical SAM protein [Candidatus Aenigmarchaeota archaeon]
MLDDYKLGQIVNRYANVALQKNTANFIIAKHVKAENFGWKHHDELMKEFYNLRKLLDEGKIALKDLKKPEFSLLDLKIKLTEKTMKSCNLCERKCGVNRLLGEVGVCKVGNNSLISSEFIHMGEEYYISPSHTIFFMGCNFFCQFCQNWSISQWFERGFYVAEEKLAKLIEERRRFSLNVNFVGGEPTPNLLFILKTLKHCSVNIPIIWNSNFYMSKNTMKILDGIVDMYLSDFKFGNDYCAERLSKVKSYFKICSRNHLIAAKNGEITIRHLVLPNHINCCSKPILKWIAKNLKDKAIVNIMSQYMPQYKAKNYPEINRTVSHEEMKEVIEYAETLELNYIT